MRNFDLEKENGRSMIEMLGVLAIIGVLSVGGIAGYSKAMQKYRINKTIEQITLIAGNVRSFFAPQRSYEGLGNCWEANSASDTQKANCKLIKKAKLMPDEMWDDTAKQFKNVFGYAVNLASFNKAQSSGSDEQAFNINYEIDSLEACIELATYDWRSANVGVIRISSYIGGKNFVPPADIDAAVDACSEAYQYRNPMFYLNIRFDIDVNSTYWQNQINPSS